LPIYHQYWCPYFTSENSFKVCAWLLISSQSKVKLNFASNRITNCLRVIRNAWHFYYALRLVFKVVCSGIGIALLTP
ncbi:hypothetical protein, partial [Vibrio alginolyticus]|uniref:hypothetical protein n=1 Tax=Vibrio alginolyticus TaxID=663 RepID=UPI003D7EC182